MNPSCPNCRDVVTGMIPCHFARDAIGALKVSCPESSGERVLFNLIREAMAEFEIELEQLQLDNKIKV